MLKSRKIVIISLVLLFLAVMMPAAFAGDEADIVTDDSDSNDITASESEVVEYSERGDNLLQDSYTRDIYFDAAARTDFGNGSNDNPYKLLKSDRIVDNSIIHMAKGTYDFNSSKIITNVTFVGQSSSNTFINGGVFYNDGILKINNITLINSSVVNYESLTINKSVFKDTTNYCVNSSDGKVIIDNSTFMNDTSNFGGSILVNDTKLEVRNSLFKNLSAHDGGAIFVLNSNATVDNCVFMDNNAEFIGGSIIALNSSLKVNRTNMSYNRAGYYGGAVYSMYGSVFVNNSLFEYNSADEGGALYIDEATPCKIDLNTFSNNNASIYGAVYLLKCNSTVDTSTCNVFENNSASIGCDFFESDNPNMDIGNSNYSMIYYEPTYNGTLPNKYDLRKYGYVTDIKDQGNDGNCWAFSALASLESCILKATNKSYDFSEANMKNLMAYFSDYGWNYMPNEGGLARMATGYLTSWLGPVNESDDEYLDSSLISPVIPSILHVQNMLFINKTNYTDNTAIKEAILKYGAVSTVIAWYDLFTYRNTYYCYQNYVTTNHAIAIIGWDDTYSRYNFVKSAPANGAWIIKNSWGSDVGDDGYYYVSYYDTSLAIDEFAYTFIFNDSIKYDHNYQYDPYGFSDFYINKTENVWYKNKFTAKNNEYLESVSTFFLVDSDYEIKVYVNDELKVSQNASSKSGYYTIHLDKKLALHPNDTFVVEFKITSENETSVPIYERINNTKDEYKRNISFISNDGKNWVDLSNLTGKYDIHTYYGQIACIKAFTCDMIANVNLSKSSDNPCEITAIVYDQYNNRINDGFVTFKLFNESINVELNNSVAKLIKTLPAGTNNITAVYNATGYVSNPANITIEVAYTEDTKIETSISILSHSAAAGSTATFTANVFDLYSNNVTGGKIVFKINGKTLKDQNNRIIYAKVINGIASINYTIPDTWADKTYNLSVVYSGSIMYKSVRNSTSLYIDKKMASLVISPISDATEGDVIQINAQVKMGDKPISTGKIIFKLNGKVLRDENNKIIYAKVDSNGEVSLNYTLNKMQSRLCTLTATFSASGYEKIQNETKFNIVG